MIQRDNVSAETLAGVLDAARSVESDYERAQVLVAAARAHTFSSSAREAYIRIAETLGEYERNRSLAALARTQR